MYKFHVYMESFTVTHASNKPVLLAKLCGYAYNGSSSLNIRAMFFQFIKLIDKSPTVRG